MTENDPPLELAAAFPAPTREQWQQRVSAVLAKSGRAPGSLAGVEQALASTTAEGIVVAPLYTADDAPAVSGLPGFAPFVRGRRPEGNAGGWDVRARHADPDPARTRAAVLDDLENGVTSLWLAVGDGGLALADLPQALDGVLLDLIAVVLDPGADVVAATEALLALATQRGVEHTALTGNLGADPIAHLARTGEPGDSAAAAALAVRAVAHLPGMRALVVDGLPWHEAGGTDADELGLSLAHGVAHLRLLLDAGLTVEQAAGQLEFRYAATADQFATIAKLRAGRRLWARVLEVSGVAPAQRGQLQHAVTSWTMTTALDPWVTMLRDTLATFGAGVGGADAVTVLPFDAPLGLPVALSRRMARNTSVILMDESHLTRVTDPGGGSYFVEQLTDDLARAAWQVFQEIERAGGIEAGLRHGSVGDRLAASAEGKRARLAVRTDAVTGVSEFPLLDEVPLRREPAPARESGGLPRLRWSQEHEDLRAASGAYAAATGHLPVVFALTVGPLRSHSARLDYVRNLFAPGGIVVQDGSEVPTAVPPVIVVVAADDVEPADVAPLVSAAKAAGAVRVLRAGRPARGTEETWHEIGVQDFVFIGVDALAVLHQTHDDLGVTS